MQSLLTSDATLQLKIPFGTALKFCEEMSYFLSIYAVLTFKHFQSLQDT